MNSGSLGESMSKIIRITENAYDTLDKLAAETGSSKQLIIDKALENLARKHFLLKTNKAYQALKNNPKEWAEMLEERAEWDK